MLAPTRRPKDLQYSGPERKPPWQSDLLNRRRVVSVAAQLLRSERGPRKRPQQQRSADHERSIGCLQNGSRRSGQSCGARAEPIAIRGDRRSLRLLARDDGTPSVWFQLRLRTCPRLRAGKDVKPCPTYTLLRNCIGSIARNPRRLWK